MANVSIVNWGSYLHPVEAHGARIKHQVGVVEYTSPLLPPGTNIYTWQSEGRFQDIRMQGALPILRGNHTYQLIGKLEAIPENSAYFRVATYDHENQFIKEFILEGSGGTFDYPVTARRYNISLVVKANQLVRFKWLAIGLANELADVKLEVSDDLRISAVLADKPQGFNIYVTKKGASSWLVPVQADSSQAVIRLTDDEIENGDTTSFALLDQVFKKYDLTHYQTRIRAYGYPLTSVVQAFQERLSRLKGE
ncbi:accessory Sec system protein Asp3 [Lentilactobacillus raoultii]|uniref:Accessory Sec system protein Asp3 n=1 Tax=Lentilactobacillus raoultii TaxID=1987503 RepID=A0ABW3PJB7_9LACO|nr:accessory Sec system protein Asp3 [Lentilactobacillus raoultii]